MSLKRYAACKHSWDREHSFFSMKCRRCDLLIDQQDIYLHGWEEAIWVGILHQIPEIQQKMLKNTAPPDWVHGPR